MHLRGHALARDDSSEMCLEASAEEILRVTLWEAVGGASEGKRLDLVVLLLPRTVRVTRVRVRVR